MQLRHGSRIVTTVLALVLLAGCSGSDDRSSGDAAQSTGAAAPGAAYDASGAGSAEKAAEPVALRPNEKKIRTGTIELTAGADRVTAAADRAARVAEAVGGEVSEHRSTGGDHPTADLVLRVPPEQFRDAVERLEAIATVRSSNTRTQDVTGQYADLEGRLGTMRISVTRLQGFLSKATDVNQIASLEAELTRRESELESTQAQLDALACQVDLATIEVSIVTRNAPVVVATSGPPSPVGALDRGWSAFVAAVRYLLAGLAVSLPFLVVAGVAVVVVRKVRRPRPVTG